MQRISCDVLVIGGGGAGAMAAYESSKYNVKVVLASKGKTQRCGCTIMAPGAIAGVDNKWSTPGDSQELHTLDTIQGGVYLNEQNLVRIVVEESPKLILEMESIGALWQREKNGFRYALRSGGGHQFPRSVFLEDRTGKELMRTLIGELRSRDVQIMENVMILRLIHDGKDIFGAIGIHLENLEFILFEMKTAILATGGAGNVYENTDNPIDITGDGYALAYQEGLSLMDMEFVQFYPIGFIDPPSLQGELAGLIDYSHLLNFHKERFMERYDPERMENSTRDRVTRAIFQEIQEGRGTPNGGVYCDLTFHEPGFIKTATPSLYKTYRQINIDPEKELFEIAPTCHFFMGGLIVDENWQTNLGGLFAAGEVCAGLHGANRLSQNALAEILVSGKYSGEKAAEVARIKNGRKVHPKEVLQDKEKIENILQSKENNRKFSKLNIGYIQKRLKKVMWCNAGIIRTKKELLSTLDEIEDLQENIGKVSMDNSYPNWELVKYLETKNLLTVSKIIILSSLEREESRGAHYREDYPEKNDNKWLKHIMIRKANDMPVISYQAVNQSLGIREGNENARGYC